jgi:hypothetical protein
MGQMPGARPTAVLLALVASSCATVPRAADEGGKRWYRAETEHLSLETNLGRKEALALAPRLETWRFAMTAALFKGARPPRQKLQIVVLANRGFEAIDYTRAGTFSDVDYIGTVGSR